MKYTLLTAATLMAALCLTSCGKSKEDQLRAEMELRLEQEKKLLEAEAKIKAAEAQTEAAKAETAKAEAAKAQAEAAKAKANTEAQASSSSSSNGAYTSSCNSPYGTTVMVKREGGYTNIRSGQGTSYGIVEKVRDGSYIKVGSCYGQWYEVYNANGSIKGYIHATKIVF